MEAIKLNDIEQSNYDNLIDILNRYSESTFLKITTKGLIKNNILVMSRKSEIYNTNLKMVSYHLDGEFPCIELRLARSTVYNSYTGLNPKKDFSTSAINDIRCLASYIEFIFLKDIISIEVLDKDSTTYEMLFS